MADECFKYTEEFMQRELSHFFAYNTVKYEMDGVFIFDWESDKFIETRSGYIYEFEVKVSKSDFKNDFKHKEDKHLILEGKRTDGDEYLPKYYRLIEENRKRGGEWAVNEFKKYADKSPHYKVSGHKRPNFFYYCTPPDMITKEDVPSYAGLLYINEYGTIRIIKKAPRLHPDKLTDGELGLGEKFYYHMDNWRRKCRKESESNDYLRECLKRETDEKGEAMPYAELEDKHRELTAKYKSLSDEHRRDKYDILWEADVRRKLTEEIKRLNPDFDFNAVYDNATKWVDEIKKETALLV